MEIAMKNQIVVMIEGPSVNDSARVLGKFKNDKEAYKYVSKYAAKHRLPAMAEIYWYGVNGTKIEVPLEKPIDQVYYGKITSTSFYDDETRQFIINKEGQLCPISQKRAEDTMIAKTPGRFVPASVMESISVYDACNIM